MSVGKDEVVIEIEEKREERGDNFRNQQNVEDESEEIINVPIIVMPWAFISKQQARNVVKVTKKKEWTEKVNEDGKMVENECSYVSNKRYALYWACLKKISRYGHSFLIVHGVQPQFKEFKGPQDKVGELKEFAQKFHFCPKNSLPSTNAGKYFKMVEGKVKMGNQSPNPFWGKDAQELLQTLTKSKESGHLGFYCMFISNVEYKCLEALVKVDYERNETKHPIKFRARGLPFNFEEDGDPKKSTRDGHNCYSWILSLLVRARIYPRNPKSKSSGKRKHFSDAVLKKMLQGPSKPSFLNALTHSVAYIPEEFILIPKSTTKLDDEGNPIDFQPYVPLLFPLKYDKTKNPKYFRNKWERNGEKFVITKNHHVLYWFVTKKNFNFLHKNLNIKKNEKMPNTNSILVIHRLFDPSTKITIDPTLRDRYDLEDENSKEIIEQIEILSMYEDEDDTTTGEKENRKMKIFKAEKNGHGATLILEKLKDWGVSFWGTTISSGKSERLCKKISDDNECGKLYHESGKRLYYDLMMARKEQESDDDDDEIKVLSANEPSCGDYHNEFTYIYEKLVQFDVLHIPKEKQEMMTLKKKHQEIVEIEQPPSSNIEEKKGEYEFWCPNFSHPQKNEFMMFKPYGNGNLFNMKDHDGSNAFSESDMKLLEEKREDDPFWTKVGKFFRKIFGAKK